MVKSRCCSSLWILAILWRWRSVCIYSMIMSWGDWFLHGNVVMPTQAQIYICLMFQYMDVVTHNFCLWHIHHTPAYRCGISRFTSKTYLHIFGINYLHLCAVITVIFKGKILKYLVKPCFLRVFCKDYWNSLKFSVVCIIQIRSYITSNLKQHVHSL